MQSDNVYKAQFSTTYVTVGFMVGFMVLTVSKTA